MLLLNFCFLPIRIQFVFRIKNYMRIKLSESLLQSWCEACLQSTECTMVLVKFNSIHWDSNEFLGKFTNNAGDAMKAAVRRSTRAWQRQKCSGMLKNGFKRKDLILISQNRLQAYVRFLKNKFRTHTMHIKVLIINMNLKLIFLPMMKYISSKNIYLWEAR